MKIKYLINCFHANVNEKDNEYGSYPLLMAIKYFNIDMVRLIMKYANKKAADCRRASVKPFHISLMLGKRRAVRNNLNTRKARKR